MTLALPLVLLAAFDLPELVESPGPGHVNLSGGIDRLRPAADVRIGLFRWWDLGVEFQWTDGAPLFGTKLRFALGEKEQTVFAHIWTDGHLRALLDDRVVSGGDLGVGGGVVGVWSGFSVRLDGGIAVGFAAAEARDIESTAIDQQGGFFAIQRLWLGYDFTRWLAVSGGVDVAIPVGRLDFTDETERIVRKWHFVPGARLSVRI